MPMLILFPVVCVLVRVCDVFSCQVVVSNTVLRLRPEDVLAVRVSKVELLAGVFTGLRLSAVLVLVAVSSSGEADLSFIISDDGSNDVVEGLVIFWLAMLVVGLFLAGYLVVHRDRESGLNQRFSAAAGGAGAKLAAVRAFRGAGRRASRASATKAAGVTVV